MEDYKSHFNWGLSLGIGGELNLNIKTPKNSEVGS